MAEQTRRLVLHPSLHKPLLVAGGEREATFALWFVCLAVPILMGLLYVPIGIVVALTGQIFLRGLAKSDPQSFGVMRKHWSQQAFYASQSTPFVPQPYKAPAETGAPLAHVLMAGLSKLFGKGK